HDYLARASYGGARIKSIQFEGVWRGIHGDFGGLLERQSESHLRSEQEQSQSHYSGHGSHFGTNGFDHGGYSRTRQRSFQRGAVSGFHEFGGFLQRPYLDHGCDRGRDSVG